MIIDDVVRQVDGMFPFSGYMRESSREGRGDLKQGYEDTWRTVARYLQPGSRLLDFGSGPCDKTAVLQLMGYECSAYDDLQDDWHTGPGRREKIMEFARGCGIDFKLATDDKTLPFADSYFDMVMLHGVLEHLHDSPRDILNDLLRLVKDGGFIFITVPNAVNIRKRVDVLFGRTNLPPFPTYYWYPGPWRGHVREYVKKDLLLLARYLDCQVVELRGCDRMLDKLPRRMRSIYLGCTAVFEGWKDTWLLVAKKKPGWAPRKVPPEGETMTRISDE